MELNAPPLLAEIPVTYRGEPSHSARFLRGWHYLEQADGETYRWTEPEFEIALEAVGDCLVLEYNRPGIFGAADCLITGPDGWVEMPVRPCRARLIVDLGPIIRAPGSLRFSLSKTGRAAGDPRAFGLCVYSVLLADGIEANRARRDQADIELPTTVRHLPTELSVASTDRCNLRCVMCGAHHAQTGDNNAGREDLSGSLMRKIGVLAAGADQVQLHGGAGEPLFNPQFWQMVGEFSRVEGRNVEIHTNGLLFNPRNIAQLMESAITHVSLSFDAASEAMYRKIRGGSFQKLLANVADLVEARRRCSRTDLRFDANMTVFQANAHEAAGLVELAHRLGLDAVMLMHLNSGDAYNWTENKSDGWVFDYRANLPSADPGHVRNCIDEAIQAAAALNLQLIVDPRLLALEANTATPSPANEATPLSPPEPAPGEPPTAARSLQYGDCRTPWHWLNVAANGDVYPCCWAAHPLGNLNNVDSLAEIWNGQKIRELRHNIRDNRLDRDICDGASCLYVAYGKADA